MNDDELRNRLARLDPHADAPVEPFTSPRAQDLLERSMTTSSTTELSDPSPSTPPRNRRPLAMVAAASVAAAGIVAAVVMSNGDSPAAPVKKTTLALKAAGAAAPGHGGPIMNSCIRFDVELLKAEPVAFAGTVTDVQPGTVTLDVTKWFKGGTADQVTVTTPDSSNVALEGVEFTKGEDVLVSAFDGTVVSCGFSGPDDPTLRTAYEDAFGG